MDHIIKMKPKGLMKPRDVLVIDDFLTPSYHLELYNLLMGRNFPWSYAHNITNTTADGEYGGLGSFGFEHWILQFERAQMVDCNSPVKQLIMPFLFQVQYIIGECKPIRSRIDMTLYNPEKFVHGVHTDLAGIFHWSCVYYVNDSDGETIIYNAHEEDSVITEADLSPSNVKKVVEPRANRVVIFDGNYYHTGHSPAVNKNRVIINSNFK